MGFHDLVSESEAATTCKISIATLKRFVEAGYLRVESDSDGVPLYSKSELATVFGLMEFPSSSVPSNIANDLKNANSEFLARVHQPIAQEVVASSTTTNAEAPTSLEGSPSINEVPLNSTVESIPLQKQNILEATNTRALLLLENETTRLKHLSNLQEKLLGLREQEIIDLKQQRDWLKGRLERLEEKSDRDQLLLLAETQTIRKLVTLQENKRSSFVLALEWLGFKGADSTIPQSQHQVSGNVVTSNESTGQHGHTKFTTQATSPLREARDATRREGGGRKAA